MYKKKIKYTDYNNVEREEDFFFNLTKAELAELQFSKAGGLDDALKKIISNKDEKSILEIFKEIILKAYGEKSEDGKRFIKKDSNGNKLADYFESTEAYSNLFMELVSDEDASSNFIKGILPVDISTQLDKANATEELQKLLND